MIDYKKIVIKLLTNMDNEQNNRFFKQLFCMISRHLEKE